MANGGAGSVQTQNTEKKASGGDDFGRAVARIAVAQICDTTGFQSCHQSALDALTDIALRYLRDLGKSAHYYSNLAGRTDCNVFDVIQGMEDMNDGRAAIVMGRKLSASQALRGVMVYTNRAEEIPFARPVPRFPVVKKRPLELIPSFIRMGETPPNGHVPAWLPALPDPHTYVHTPVWNERRTDPRMDKMEQARQRRKAERSLINLQQRLATAKGSPNTNPNHGPNHNAITNPNAIPNPFLLTPVTADERAVSPIRRPGGLSSKEIDQGVQRVESEKMFSVLEAFAPAIEAANQGMDRAEELFSGMRSENNGLQLLPDERPLVQFKFDFGKKAALAAHVTAARAGEQPLSSWFGREEEKDEKKRRAEQILKAAMENPQELAQL